MIQPITIMLHLSKALKFGDLASGFDKLPCTDVNFFLETSPRTKDLFQYVNPMPLKGMVVSFSVE